MTEKFVEWRPEWAPKEEKQVEAAVSEIRRRVSTLKALRQQLGLSQAELSEILDTSQSNVSKIETRGEPRLSVLRKVIEHKGGTLRLVAELNGETFDLAL